MKLLAVLQLGVLISGYKLREAKAVGLVVVAQTILVSKPRRVHIDAI